MNIIKPSVFATALIFSLVSGSAIAQNPASAAKAAPAAATAPTTLKIIDRKIGDGALAETGAPVNMHYSGYLWDATAADNKGKKFDSSIERKMPFGFIIGAGRVIKGWDEGIPGMKVGGQRTLIIPPDKGYGERGAGADIPANATLVFDVELVSVIGKTVNATGAPSPYVPAPKN